MSCSCVPLLPITLQCLGTPLRNPKTLPWQWPTGPITSLTPSSTLPVTHLAPATLLHNYAYGDSGPLHLLFPWPTVLFPQPFYFLTPSRTWPKVAFSGGFL